ncbi:hypothetical protein F5X99DRAFT_426955 [Biscogniauxia marginata]|nr:hypothetical protein F5X99DRAFT_426955 [Biscogniauxia marginata]
MTRNFANAKKIKVDLRDKFHSFRLITKMSTPQPGGTWTNPFRPPGNDPGAAENAGAGSSSTGHTSGTGTFSHHSGCPNESTRAVFFGIVFFVVRFWEQPAVRNCHRIDSDSDFSRRYSGGAGSYGLDFGFVSIAPAYGIFSRASQYASSSCPAGTAFCPTSAAFWSAFCPNITIVNPSQVPFLWYNCPVMAPSNPPGQNNQVHMSFPQATHNGNSPFHLGTSHFLTNPPQPPQAPHPQIYIAQPAYVPQGNPNPSPYGTAASGPVYVMGAPPPCNNGPIVFYHT